MKTITLIEAFQDGTLTQKQYTKIHNDVTGYITNSKDRLLAWYEVDSTTLAEIENVYSKRKETTGRSVPEKTYEAICINMDRPSERI